MPIETSAFSITELIGNIYLTAQPFFSAIAPWVWSLMGITISFIILSGLLNFILDWLQGKGEEKEELAYEKDMIDWYHLKYGMKKGDEIADKFLVQRRRPDPRNYGFPDPDMSSWRALQQYRLKRMGMYFD